MLIVKRQKYLKMELWLFILISLIVFSVAAYAEKPDAPGAKYLQRFSICKDVLEKNPMLEKNFFTSQDEKVVAWFKFTYNSTENFKLYWEWIDPQGKLYHRGEIEMKAGSYTNYRTWYWIKIKDNYASMLPGEWKVKVYIDKMLLTEEKFFIIESL